MTTSEIFGRNLRDKLEERNKSQAQLARHLKTTTATVSRWVTGESLPRSPMIDRICEYLMCGADELMLDSRKTAILLPEDVIADEIRERPMLFKLFVVAMGATDEQIEACIALLKK